MNEIKTFEERKEELLKKGKEKGFLTFEELAAALKGLDMDSESLDDLYNFLNDKNIWHEITEHKAVFHMAELS